MYKSKRTFSLEDAMYVSDAGESEAREYLRSSQISSRKQVDTGCVRPSAVITGQFPKYLENKLESTVADLSMKTFYQDQIYVDVFSFFLSFIRFFFFFSEWCVQTNLSNNGYHNIYMYK